MGETSVRLKALDGRWEEVGKDRYPGLVPESVNAQSDSGGFAACTFQLYRPEPWLPQPDLSAWTPCEIDDAEARIFEGRVQETPIAGDTSTITVAGKGYQIGLDDNSIEPVHVHSDLSAWVDMRTLPGAELTTLRSAYNVDIADGSINLIYPQGSTVAQFSSTVGVTLDLGPDHKAQAISVDWFAINGYSSAYNLYARTHPDTYNTVSGAMGYHDFFVRDFNSPVTGLYSEAQSNIAPFRYVSLFLWYVGAGGVEAADRGVRITGARVFGGRDRFYGASQGSFLRASDVVWETLRRTPELVPTDLGASLTHEPEEYVEEVAACTPYAHWRLGSLAEAGGNTLKTLTNPAGVTFSASGGPILDDGPSPYASFVAASTQYLRLTTITAGQPNHYPAGGFAVSAWVRTTQTVGVYDGSGVDQWTEGAGIVSGSLGSVNDDWGISMVGGYFQAGVGNPDQTLGNYPVSPAEPLHNDGQWRHVAFGRSRYDGYAWLAVNGVLKATATFTNRNSLTIAQSIDIGVLGGFAGSYFQGDIADVVLVERFLPPTWARRQYEAGRTRPKAPIKRTLLELPHLAATEGRTGREVIDGVNAFHRYRLRVVRDRVTRYEPPASSAKYAIGPWAAEAFANASANAGDELYNDVIVTGTDTGGQALRVRRFAAALPEAVDAPSNISFANPSADVDAAGWTHFPAGGTVTRDTTLFDSSPASLRSGTVATLVRTNLVTIPKPGATYRIDGRARPDTGTALVGNVNMFDHPVAGSGTMLAQFGLTGLTAGIWYPFSVQFSTLIEAGVQFAIQASTPGGHVNVDSLRIVRRINSLLDRRDMVRTHRLSIGFPITYTIAAELGDAYLRLHAKTPLRGAVPIGPGDLLDLQSGAPVHPRNLITEEGELVHFHGMIDPDTGAIGRDGAIASVAYDPSTETANVAIDNQRDNFEALLNRLAAVSGG